MTHARHGGWCHAGRGRPARPFRRSPSGSLAVACDGALWCFLQLYTLRAHVRDAAGHQHAMQTHRAHTSSACSAASHILPARARAPRRMQAETEIPTTGAEATGTEAAGGAAIVEVPKPDRAAFDAALKSLNTELETLEEKRARVLSRLEGVRKSSDEINVSAMQNRPMRTQKTRRRRCRGTPSRTRRRSRSLRAPFSRLMPRPLPFASSICRLAFRRPAPSSRPPSESEPRASKGFMRRRDFWAPSVTSSALESSARLFSRPSLPPRKPAPFRPQRGAYQGQEDARGPDRVARQEPRHDREGGASRARRGARRVPRALPSPPPSHTLPHTHTPPPSRRPPRRATRRSPSSTRAWTPSTRAWTPSPAGRPPRWSISRPRRS
jgi:hypothetical protein